MNISIPIVDSVLLNSSYYHSPIPLFISDKEINEEIFFIKKRLSALYDTSHKTEEAIGDILKCHARLAKCFSQLKPLALNLSASKLANTEEKRHAEKAREICHAMRHQTGRYHYYTFFLMKELESIDVTLYSRFMTWIDHLAKSRQAGYLPRKSGKQLVKIIAQLEETKCSNLFPLANKEALSHAILRCIQGPKRLVYMERLRSEREAHHLQEGENCSALQGEGRASFKVVRFHLQQAELLHKAGQQLIMNKESLKRIVGWTKLQEKEMYHLERARYVNKIFAKKQLPLDPLYYGFQSHLYQLLPTDFTRNQSSYRYLLKAILCDSDNANLSLTSTLFSIVSRQWRIIEKDGSQDKEEWACQIADQLQLIDFAWKKLHQKGIRA